MFFQRYDHDVITGDCDNARYNIHKLGEESEKWRLREERVSCNGSWQRG